MKKFSKKSRDTLNAKISPPFLLSIVFLLSGILIIINTNLDGLGGLFLLPVVVIGGGLCFVLSLLFLLGGLIHNFFHPSKKTKK